MKVVPGIIVFSGGLMDALLIYNPNAGTFRVKTATPDELASALNTVGFRPVYRATKTEAELDGVLEDVDGLVVAAGGDGTLRAVATRLIGKGIPITPIPMGTSNNICRTLNIQGTPLEIVAGLKTPRKLPFDIGRVECPWGKEYFLEGMGFGFYADSLAFYHPEEGKSVIRTIQRYSTPSRSSSHIPAR
jgi:diacylglycerol kinase (ATP)